MLEIIFLTCSSWLIIIIIIISSNLSKIHTIKLNFHTICKTECQKMNTFIQQGHIKLIKSDSSGDIRLNHHIRMISEGQCDTKV